MIRAAQSLISLSLTGDLISSASHLWVRSQFRKYHDSNMSIIQPTSTNHHVSRCAYNNLTLRNKLLQSLFSQNSYFNSINLHNRNKLIEVNNISHKSYAEGPPLRLNERVVAANKQRMKHTIAQLCPVILCIILKTKLELNTEYTCNVLLIYTTMQSVFRVSN